MDEIGPIITAFGADLRPREVRCLGSAGGFSGAVLWRLASDRGELCLRRWPREHPSPGGLRFIHDLLTQVAGTGFEPRLPVPLPTPTGKTVVEHAGHLWELTPWLAGNADYAASPSRGRLEAAMQALAGFHRAAASMRGVAPEAGVSPGVRERLDKLREASAGRESLVEQLPRCGWPELEDRAQCWMRAFPERVESLHAELAALENASLPLQPCIRDIWHAHVLFEGERVVGLVDFGAARVDSVAGDVARLLGSLDLSVGDWPAGLAAYEKLRPLSVTERRLAVAFDRAGSLLGPWNWLSWIVLQRRSFDDRAAVLARLDAGLNRLTRQASETVLNQGVG